MINRSIQCFLLDIYGEARWRGIAASAGLNPAGVEAMFSYQAVETEALITSAVRILGKPREMLLEDFGTYLVTHPNMGALRRLLRFGGATFVEFLYSLDELPDRARLAVPDLDLPTLEADAQAPTSFSVKITHKKQGFGEILVGVLRAMADDYGVLALLDHQGRQGDVDTISIILADHDFAEGRAFDLRMQA